MSSGIRVVVGAVALLCLYACGGGSGDDPDPPATDPFHEVAQAAQAAYDAERIPMGVAVYDSSGTKVFERMYGGFSPDRRVAIASASKLVSGATIFRLIDAGYLSLDSTTAELLGWQGEKGTITLRHLLSFTSGLKPEHVCTYQPEITLAECVNAIYQEDMPGAPGSRFDYGSTHLHVAGLMAEVAVGRPWHEIFDQQIRVPLGLPAEFTYYSRPRQADGMQPANPLLAGGMRASMNDYERLLRFVFHKGSWQGVQLLSPAIFDTQTIAPYPSAAIATTPAFIDVRYGLTAWLECSTPATGCPVISSPGAFGFTPWIDRATGYYAIIGMEIDDYLWEPGAGVRLQRTLKPLIEEAMGR
jgi:D-alanyl-D-alanine-carboxypeptidase/D-alanyl-D-alanine-endopeptidase